MPKKRNFLGGMQNYNPENGQYESRLTKANGEPATKENMPGGEDGKEKSFKSFSKKQDYQSVLRKWGYDPDDKLTEKQIDDVIAQLEKEQDTSDAIKGQNGKLYNRKSGVEIKEGMNDEIINAFKEKKKSFGEKETKKPTDYAGVEETPYGFIYNVGNTSITDLKAQRKSMGMDVDENKEYGYTVFKDGDEVYYSTFEEAYKSAKGKDTSFDDINSKRMGNTKFEKKTDLQTNEDIDWDLTEKNEKINGKNAKSKTRKDKYGNPLVSDEAFMIGYEAGKAYLEGSLKYNTLDSLKRSNVFLGYLSQYISNAIINNGYNPDLDITYADENEIIGAIVGEEVDMESYEINKTKGWTGRKYNGYKPKDTTFEEINAKRMGTNQ